MTITYEFAARLLTPFEALLSDVLKCHARKRERRLRAALESQRREMAREGRKYSFDGRHAREASPQTSPGKFLVTNETPSGVTGVYMGNFAGVRRRESTRRIVADGERKF